MFAAADPNWFFSTLSQSAAALVGIVGGFFVSRLLQQSSNVKEAKEQLLSDWIDTRTQIANARDRLRSYEDWATRNRPLIAFALERGQDSIPLTSEVTLKGGSWSSGTARPVAISQTYLDEIDTAIPLLETPATILRGLIQVHDLSALPDSIGAFDLWLDHPQPVDLGLGHLRVGVNRMARSIESYEAAALPPYTRALLGLLGWLSIVCVVLPLTRLSAGHHDVWRWLLTAAFALGVVGLGLVLALLAREILRTASLELPEKLWWLGD